MWSVLHHAQGSLAPRGTNPHRKGANRDSQIYLPSPSLIDLDRPPILSSSFSRKYSNIAGFAITSILFQEYEMMRDERRVSILTEKGVGRRRKVEAILESVAKIYGGSRAWSPVFSRLLACGISRRPEQPGSATIIR